MKNDLARHALKQADRQTNGKKMVGRQTSRITDGPRQDRQADIAEDFSSPKEKVSPVSP